MSFFSSFEALKIGHFLNGLNQVISSIMAIFRTNLTKEGRCMRA